jgi:DNA-binding NarL/FixJ family response regulator
LIVDDQLMFRDAARALLEAGGFAVVGESGDGFEALREVARLTPDVVFLDIQLPGVDGFAVAEQLAARSGAAARVVLISSRDAVTYGGRVSSASAVGCLAKRELSGADLAGLLE